MEELFEKLIKKYPNYYSLGAAVNWVHKELQQRKAGTKHVGFDSIDERIEIKKIIQQLEDKDFPLK